MRDPACPEFVDLVCRAVGGVRLALSRQVIASDSRGLRQRVADPRSAGRAFRQRRRHLKIDDEAALVAPDRSRLDARSRRLVRSQTAGHIGQEERIDNVVGGSTAPLIARSSRHISFAVRVGIPLA